MKYDSLIFDLDGTLWDACPTTADSWNSKLKELNIPVVLSADDIRSVAGKPNALCIEILLSKYYGPQLVADLTIAEQHAIRERGGDLYAGVAEKIPALAATHKLFIVSNCPDWYLKLFFERFQLHKHFTDWDCVGTSGLPKYQMIQNLIDNHQLQNTVYIGDTLGDEEAAQGAKIPFIHAAYGFGTAKNPKETYNSFEELVTNLS